MSALQLLPRCLVICGLVALATSVGAQALFPITGYRVLGNSLLSSQQLDAVTRPFLGASSEFETIQKALEALERAYVSAGYGSVKVELPEQELDAGVVTLQVVEGALGEVAVEPNPFFDAANVRHSLPALQPGLPVNIFDLNRNLVLANEGGAKITNVTFKRSVNLKDVDVTVKLQGDNPERWLTVLDNTGSDLNGLYRLGLVYQHANVFNRDHAISMQLMSSPGQWGQVRILGASYKVPLYKWGSTVDLSLSDSNVESRGTVAGTDIAAVGKGSILGLRWTRNLDSSVDMHHKLSLGLESRRYGNNGNTGESALSTVPLTVSYTSNWRSAQREWSVGGTWLKNVPAGPYGWTEDLAGSGGRVGADAGFHTWKFNLQWIERFANLWSLRGALSAQTTTDLLIAAEQFGAGGADSVRGFTEREVSGDQGLRWGFELALSPWGSDPWRVNPMVFVEGAAVRRNSPLAGETDQISIASAGWGLRAAYGRHASLRVDWGFVLRGLESAPGASTGGAQRGQSKLHSTLVWIY